MLGVDVLNPLFAPVGVFGFAGAVPICVLDVALLLELPNWLPLDCGAVALVLGVADDVPNWLEDCGELDGIVCEDAPVLDVALEPAVLPADVPDVWACSVRAAANSAVEPQVNNFMGIFISYLFFEGLVGAPLARP